MPTEQTTISYFDGLRAVFVEGTARWAAALIREGHVKPEDVERLSGELSWQLRRAFQRKAVRSELAAGIREALDRKPGEPARPLTSVMEILAQMDKLAAKPTPRDPRAAAVQASLAVAEAEAKRLGVS